MKHKLLFILLAISVCTSTQAQGPYLETRMVDRTVYAQDGHILVINFGAPSYVYGTSGESIATSELNALWLVQPDTTATFEPDHIEGLRVFPNPTYDKVFVERDDPGADLLIHLFAADGRAIRSVKFPVGTLSVEPSLAALPKGSYLMTITDEKGKKRNQYKLVRL